MSERVRSVRHAIVHSLVENENQRIAADTLSRIKSVEGIEVWFLIDCLFDLVDPKMLGTENDSLWIGHVFDDLPRPCQRHVNERYRERLEPRAVPASPRATNRASPIQPRAQTS